MKKGTKQRTSEDKPRARTVRDARKGKSYHPTPAEQTLAQQIFRSKRRARKEWRAVRQVEGARSEPGMTGSSMIIDHGPSGHKSGVVVLSTRMDGQGIGNPAMSIAWMIKKALIPGRTVRAPAKILDGMGRHIATVTYDLHGVATRTPVKEA